MEATNRVEETASLPEVQNHITVTVDPAFCTTAVKLAPPFIYCSSSGFLDVLHFHDTSCTMLAADILPASAYAGHGVWEPEEDASKSENVTMLSDG